MNTTAIVVEIRPEKNSGPYGLWTHDFCDTGATLYQLSQRANWELVIMLDPNKPFIYFIPIVIKLSYAPLLTFVEKLQYNKVLVSRGPGCSKIG